MSAQTTYGYKTAIGCAGGIVDLAPYAIDTFMNEEENGAMQFGMGVVAGENAGHGIAIPTSEATAATFEGVTTNNRTTEYDMDGNIRVLKGSPVGVMRYGRIYVRLAADVAPAYGDALYLVISGTDAGCFTNDSDDGIAIAGRFLGAADATTHVAQVELFNQAQTVPAAESEESPVSGD